MLEFSEMSAYKSGNDTWVEYGVARGEMPDADWNEASSKKRVINPGGRPDPSACIAY